MNHRKLFSYYIKCVGGRRRGMDGNRALLYGFVMGQWEVQASQLSSN